MCYTFFELLSKTAKNDCMIVLMTVTIKNWFKIYHAIKLMGCYTTHCQYEKRTHQYPIFNTYIIRVLCNIKHFLIDFHTFYKLTILMPVKFQGLPSH